MTFNNDNIPLDARLLSEAVIELNITRRNVSIYPKEHPIVNKSLSNALGYLEKLFELRDEITLSVAKDTLIIDDCYLEKENPVFRDFALCLSKMDISFITFITGLTVRELYSFLLFLMNPDNETSLEICREKLEQHNLKHIRTEFIDYHAFSFEEGQKTAGHGDSDDCIWERYVSGVMDNRLLTDDLPDNLKAISPEKLAFLLNHSTQLKSGGDNAHEESYDKVISAYLRTSSERAFSGHELRKLMDFINGLRPELKKQFLSSAMRNMSSNVDMAKNALKEISVNEVIDLLGQINEQKVAIPEALHNLLNVFSTLDEHSFKELFFRGEAIADDILISDEIITLLSKGDFEKFVSSTYQQQIHKLLDFNTSEYKSEHIEEFRKQFNDEYIDRAFNKSILKLISCGIPDFIQEDAYGNIITLLIQQVEEFMDTGQYPEALNTFRRLDTNAAEGRLPELASKAVQYFHSPDFISVSIDSLRIMGRIMREDSLKLIDYFGDVIIGPLMDALTEENSPTTRSYFIYLISHLKERAVPEALKRLNDNRWFVQRNMLLLLEGSISTDTLPKIRPYCNSENPKVSFQAIQCLLKSRDNYAAAGLKRHLHSNSQEVLDHAIVLSGAYRVKEAVPDLVLLLHKKTVSGADIKNKVRVVKALGQIRDPRAVEPLKNMLTTKSLLFKGDIENLKKEVKSSLAGYSDVNAGERRGDN